MTNPASGVSDSSSGVSDGEVIGYVSAYLDSRGLGGAEITPQTSLESLGLDSISLVELLLSARDQLVAEGKLPSDVALASMPTLETVSDLTALFRGLATQAA